MNINVIADILYQEVLVSALQVLLPHQVVLAAGPVKIISNLAIRKLTALGLTSKPASMVVPAANVILDFLPLGRDGNAWTA